MILLGIIVLSMFITGWHLDGPFIGAMFAVLAFALGLLFILIPTAIYTDYLIENATEYEITEVSQENIYALQDNGEIHGSFFLGSGPFQKERDDSNFVLSKSTQAKCGSIWMPGPSIPAALTPKHSREWRVNRRRLPLPAQEPLPVFGLETSQQGTTSS